MFVVSCAIAVLGQVTFTTARAASVEELRQEVALRNAAGAALRSERSRNTRRPLELFGQNKLDEAIAALQSEACSAAIASSSLFCPKSSRGLLVFRDCSLRKAAPAALRSATSCL